MKKIYRNKDSIVFANELQDFESGRYLPIAETQNFVIIQVADSYFGNSFLTPDHRQECDLEITYSLTNRLFCSTDGVEQKVGRNEAYLSYRGDVHGLSSVRGCRFKTLAFDIKEGPYTKLFEKVKEDFKTERKCGKKEISDIISLIISEISADEVPFSLEMADSLIVRVLVELARSEVSVPQIDVMSANEILPSVMNFIDSNFTEIYSVDEIGARFGYDYSYISKAFKKCYGISPGKYLNSKKMEYGAELLKKGNSVKTVAEKLGYSTPYNFSRAFKTYFGMPPSVYIERFN